MQGVLLSPSAEVTAAKSTQSYRGHPQESGGGGAGGGLRLVWERPEVLRI